MKDIMEFFTTVNILFSEHKRTINLTITQRKHNP